jgi:hypothetical protein
MIRIILSTIIVLVISTILWKNLGWSVCRFLAYGLSEYEAKIIEVTADDNSSIHIQNVVYRKDGIDASYPEIVSGGSDVMRKEWNQIIRADFDKILQIYSFQPFPEPTPSSTGVVPTLLTVSYEIKGNTEGWLSIFYLAQYNSAYSAHPSNLVYTTNIDKRHSRRIRLSDIIEINDAFVEEFRTWKLKDNPQDTKEIQAAIYDYINHISNEELLAGFRAADHIGSDNPWGIYSYLTNDSLGVSIEVPNYAGDHAEFEQALTHLNQYLKPELTKPTLPVTDQ